MTHEIFSELARRQRNLPDRDGSRYQTVKLVIQRSGRNSAVCSLVFVDVGGQRLSDTRLAFAVITTTDSVGRQLSPMALMARATNAILIDSSEDPQAHTPR
jgi:hypothetical protein